MNNLPWTRTPDLGTPEPEVNPADEIHNAPMTAADFAARFGFPPERDDLERVTCETVGLFGHQLCGVCATHSKPRFACGCVAHKCPNCPALISAEQDRCEACESEHREQVEVEHSLEGL